MLEIDQANYPDIQPEDVKITETALKKLRECVSETQKYKRDEELRQQIDDEEAVRRGSALRAYASAIGIQAAANNPNQPKYNTVAYVQDDIDPTLNLLSGVFETVEPELGPEAYAKFENSVALAIQSYVATESAATTRG